MFAEQKPQKLARKKFARVLKTADRVLWSIKKRYSNETGEIGCRTIVREKLRDSKLLNVIKNSCHSPPHEFTAAACQWLSTRLASWLFAVSYLVH
jgi:hypothetical protein